MKVPMAAIDSAERPAVAKRPSSRAWRLRLGEAAPLWTIIALVLLWEIVCRVLSIPQFVLPAPSVIWHSAEQFGVYHWADNFLATLQIVIVGFAASIAISLPLAIVLTHFHLLSRTISPVLIIIQLTPIVSIAP